MLPLRDRIHSMLLTLSVLAVVGAAAPVPAWAQAGRLEARYNASLAGITLGKGRWVVDITDTHYSAAASGVTTGLMHVFTGGEGTGAAHGAMNGDRLISSIYAATIKTRHKTNRVRLTLSHDNLKDLELDPPQDHNPHRVPMTAAYEHGILDPMTASLVRVPGDGKLLSPQACHRKVAIFDGRLRYDLALAFKRMDRVKAEKGYAGPVVVCAVYFSPVAGYIPSRIAIKYLAERRDIEVWLAPIAGTRVLVPFRAQVPTPIGEAKLQATQFVSEPGPSRASAARAKIQ